MICTTSSPTSPASRHWAASDAPNSATSLPCGFSRARPSAVSTPSDATVTSGSSGSSSGPVRQHDDRPDHRPPPAWQFVPRPRGRIRIPRSSTPRLADPMTTRRLYEQATGGRSRPRRTPIWLSWPIVSPLVAVRTDRRAMRSCSGPRAGGHPRSGRPRRLVRPRTAHVARSTNGPARSTPTSATHRSQRWQPSAS